MEHGQNVVVDGKARDQRRQAVQRAEKERQAPTKAEEKRENHPQEPDEDGGQYWVKPRQEGEPVEVLEWGQVRSGPA